ncbi:MAG: LolA-like outer membrane lipoprotein chaperone [Campylobacteraceae bacterium]|jgi:outer membrane lipoprotein carrier protein|nr:LolA-like outer membrane lipoprotein chaperone [Campylobacteraceae bacterium]
MRFLTLLFIFISFANADENTLSSIASDFTQIIKNSENDTIKYSGNFQAMSEGANNFAFWNYKTPLIKKIYFVNNDVIILEPDLQQAVITNIDEMPDISHILSEAVKANKQTNKEIKTNFNDTNYTISFQNGTPVKISYTDTMENKIEILLHNTLLNVNIDKLSFRADIPMDYDIIRY